MNKTHKKILGFAGLGLVTAVTAVAATLPGPDVSAESAIDTIMVRVIPAESDITISSSSGEEVTEPEFNINILYSGITDIKLQLVNKDDAGNIIFGPVDIWHIDADWDPGSKDINLNLNDYGGFGNFTFTVTGLGHESVPVEKILTAKFKKKGGQEVDGGELIPDPDTGEADTGGLDIPKQGVESVTLNIYDETGTLVKGPINISNPSDVENIDLSDLPDGIYTGEIITRDGDGDVIDIRYVTFIVDTDGTGGQVDIDIDDPEGLEKVTITVTNSGGEVVGSGEYIAPSIPSSAPVDFDSLPAGIYTVTTNYYDGNGNLIDTVVTTVIKSGLDGHVDVDIEKEVDTITTIKADVYDDNGNLVRVAVADRLTGEVKVYDADGNLIETLPNGYTDAGGINIPFEGLPYGEYKVKVSFLNKNGKQIGDIYVYRVSWYGKVPVPDTGGFFQNLNISREDYLITGLIVFMVVGVVAFGVVARNKKNRKTSKRSRR